MARRTQSARSARQIQSYSHPNKVRVNNPLVGLVTPKTDPDVGCKKTYAYDPHLDPQLQWAGKTEHSSFKVPTVSLHVHERIDPRTIMEAVRKGNGDAAGKRIGDGVRQTAFFEALRDIPLRQEIEFYQHTHNWSNRLIAGDSLLVMNSLLQKENMAGKVQCVYMDPSYGIKYGSNFQPFTNKRDVKDGKDDDLTVEPETIKAFRDTWELGIHSYLSYMRDRLLLAKELLGESGSIFVRISDDNMHHIREIMDEVFEAKNFIANIGYRTRSPLAANYVGNTFDYILWYSKNIKSIKFREIFRKKNTETNPEFSQLEKYENIWTDTYGEADKRYVVQTQSKVIQRCILMTTDPGDLVFDPSCGSGTTAYVAEQWGRRWISCDTSRVAAALARQRLMTASYDYYKLACPDEGVGSGFEYKKVPHTTLKSIAKNEPSAEKTLYDQPLKDIKRVRVTGPFTVEAVSSPTVQPIDATFQPEPVPANESSARSGEIVRQEEWCAELLKTGIRGKNGQRISFSRVESLPCRWLHADAETKPDAIGAAHIADATATSPRRAVISFGPAHAPLEKKQVELALQEAGNLRSTPSIIVFAAFQFDPEAAKDIDETNWPGVTLLKAQMNADMQNQNLKKKRASNESYWLIGQPDVSLRQIRKGSYTGQWQVEVHGFDYFNTKTGELESGGEQRITMWMLDTNYDGRSLYPNQVFFPMAGDKDGWARLAKNLKTEIDEDLIELYRGAVSLPFKIGNKERVAVKIIDDRGVASLRIMPLFK